MIALGLDIGSNSVGSAWVDTERRLVDLGVGVFPAGVEQEPNKRGAPVNQKRREKRSQRRSLARRAERGRRLRMVLAEAGLLPATQEEFDRLMRLDALDLRKRALTVPLRPHEFGRVLVHLNRRRGATGISLEDDEEKDEGESKKKTTSDKEDDEEGIIKDAIVRLREARKAAGAETVGQFLAELRETRRTPLAGNPDVSVSEPIRNRQYRMDPKGFLYADRGMVRDEFLLLWDRQKSSGGELGALLTDDLKKRLDDPTPDQTWRHRGALFGQRRTYWDTGTLGRCDLEPTDRCCPQADMHAQEFRVVGTVNNIRIQTRGERPRPLKTQERETVLAALRSQKTASVSTVRKALGIDGKADKAFHTLNIENDPEGKPNTDWFYHQIVHGVFTEPGWKAMNDRQRESVNRAILKFDPDVPAHPARLAEGAVKWWGLSPEAAGRLVEAWKHRPKLENRLNLSRKAILNLLPYMNQPDPDGPDPETSGRWPTQPEARQRFAYDGEAIDQATGQEPTPSQRDRYGRGAAPLSRAAQRFLEKHPDLLPPAPMLSNPVVRKAVHEVRRHVIEYLRKYGRRPDRIVIELARDAKHSAVVRDRDLARNRQREKIRKAIREEFHLDNESESHRRKAEDRVILCRQQRNLCPYCDQCITETVAAKGVEVERDHIVPESRSFDNGLNNRVLCHKHCNQGKGSQTPMEWLSPEKFQDLENRLNHFRKPEGLDKEYFTFRDFRRKWDNFHRDPRPEEFRNSDLSDSSYAATQVADYLNGCLYAGASARHVYFTKGVYTALLRDDWQLKDQKLEKKSRDDHRHHAIDAAVIALTDTARIQDLARHAAEQEEARARGAQDPKRMPLPPPWGTVKEFRDQVMDRLGALVVSHRRVKRRLSGALHEEGHYGPVLEGTDRTANPVSFTKRIQAVGLTPKHLRLPVGGADLEKRMEDPSLSEPERRAAWGKLRALPDVKPGGTDLVRELSLRVVVRRCLRTSGLDPDQFSAAEIKKLVQAGRVRMASGVPIKSVVLLRTIKDPVVIRRRVFDPATGKTAPDDDPRTRDRSIRVYESGNNHHVEIRQDPHGRWTGTVVTAFRAACRVRRRCAAVTCEGCRGASGYVPSEGGKSVPAVDRSDHGEDWFVMSLSKGETLHMRHPETGEPGYFVVAKMRSDDARVFLIQHWDARPDKPPENQAKRELIPVGISRLKDLGAQAGQPPRKVRVSPLGEITPLEKD